MLSPSSTASLSTCYYYVVVSLDMHMTKQIKADLDQALSISEFDHVKAELLRGFELADNSFLKQLLAVKD